MPACLALKPAIDSPASPQRWIIMRPVQAEDERECCLDGLACMELG